MNMDEQEHLLYHLEVALEGCGVPGCDFDKALALHFQAVNEAMAEADRGLDDS